MIVEHATHPQFLSNTYLVADGEEGAAFFIEMCIRDRLHVARERCCSALQLLCARLAVRCLRLAVGGGAVGAEMCIRDSLRGLLST